MKTYKNFFFFKERACNRYNQQIIPRRSEDMIFYSCRDIKGDDKHLRITSQWHLRHVINQDFSLQKYQIGSICKSWKL